MSYVKDPKPFFNTPLPQKHKQDNFGVLRVVLVAVLFGFAAGFVGSQVYGTYVFPAYEGQILRDQPVIQPQVTIVTEDALGMIPLVAFEKKQATIYPATTERFFRPESAVGRATVLTSDGWLFTTSDVLGAKQNFRAVGHDGQVYEILEVVRDQLAGVSFFKVDADNLSVVGFKDFGGLHEHDRAYVADLGNVLKEYSITAKDSRPGATGADSSSDTLEHRIVLEPAISDSVPLGSPVFSQDGEVLAIVTKNADGRLEGLALEFLEGSIRQLLRDGEVLAADYGFSYVNLAQAQPAGEEDLPQQGALLLNTPKNPLARSALAGALEEGDIIVSINGQRVFSPYPLEYLLRKNLPAKEVTLNVLRAASGEREEVIVPLQ